jgi:hypothetical protein
MEQMVARGARIIVPVFPRENLLFRYTYGNVKYYQNGLLVTNGGFVFENMMVIYSSESVNEQLRG